MGILIMYKKGLYTFCRKVDGSRDIERNAFFKMAVTLIPIRPRQCRFWLRRHPPTSPEIIPCSLFFSTLYRLFAWQGWGCPVTIYLENNIINIFSKHATRSLKLLYKNDASPSRFFFIHRNCCFPNIIKSNWRYVNITFIKLRNNF